MNLVFVLAHRVSKIARSIFGFQKGGSAIETKSVKKNEIPQKGQFNIMVGYNQQNVLPTENEISKWAAVSFKNPIYLLYFACLLSLLNLLQSLIQGRL